MDIIAYINEWLPIVFMVCSPIMLSVALSKTLKDEDIAK